MQNDRLVVLIDGRELQGWKSLDIARPFAAASGSFRIGVAPARGGEFQRGQEARILLADAGPDGQLLNGYVNAFRARGDTSGSTATLAGRDRAADLVDCAGSDDIAEIDRVSIGDLVRRIVKPFGVEVVEESGFFFNRSLIFDRFARNPGETAWATIERALRMRGLTAYSRGDGALVIGGPSKLRAPVDLELPPADQVLGGRRPATAGGVPIRSWELTQDDSQRFSTYTVRAQHFGIPGFTETDLTAVSASALDPGVSRFRPMEILAEGSMLPGEADSRAQIEASVRAARSDTLQVVVEGFRQIPSPDGLPWQVNRTLRVRIPTIGLDGERFIDAVQFRKSEQGASTTLKLVRPDAYQLKAEVPDGPAFNLSLKAEGEE